MTNTKRSSRILMIITTLFFIINTVIGLGFQTISATCTANKNAFDVPTSTKYAKVYTLKTTGTTIPYTSSTLNTRGTVTYGKSSTAYIDNKNDQLYLLDAGITNGKEWAKVSYPMGSKRAVAYIALSAISSAGYNSKHLYYEKSLGKFYIAPRKNASTTKDMYVDKGDKVYVLSVDSASGNNVQILYPTSDAKWRLGWCSYNDAVKYLDGTDNSSSKSSFDPIWPCASSKAYYITCLYYYKDGTKHSTHYNYKYGMDISGGGNIVSVESGVITEVGYQKNGFGNYIYIKHNNGTTSLYAHLSSVSVKRGQTVSKGQKIGVMGNTGNSTGTHLHFELSNCDPFMTYFHQKYEKQLSFQENVYNNNKKYNSDKTICNIISNNYKLSNDGYYYHK